MTLDQQESVLEALELEADDVAAFIAAMDTCRLQMIGTVIHEELSFRCQGKPSDHSRLH